MTVRDLTAADAEEMAAIATACFDRPWSVDGFRGEVDGPSRTYVGAFDGPTLVGFAGSADLAGELHVMTAAVLPSHRRRGIGRDLVACLLRRAKQRAVTSATLEVRASDLGATAMYESLGFVAVGERPGYYGDDAALIMTRTGL